MTTQFDRDLIQLHRRRAIALACFREPTVMAVTVSGQTFTRKGLTHA